MNTILPDNSSDFHDNEDENILKITQYDITNNFDTFI